MLLRDIVSIVNGTGDPAFAIDGQGLIAVWNRAAEEVFSIASADACGIKCSEVIKGVDECGIVCSDDCIVLQHSEDEPALRNFDLLVETPNGKNWFNSSLICLHCSGESSPYKIHILRQIDLQKRLEMSVRQFLVNETDVSDDQAATLKSAGHSMLRDVSLTQREIEVLKLRAEGMSSPVIAEKLYISSATVNNHLQHVLKKLNAHSRIEAVYRAEHSGII